MRKFAKPFKWWRRGFWKKDVSEKCASLNKDIDKKNKTGTDSANLKNQPAFLCDGNKICHTIIEYRDKFG